MTVLFITSICLVVMSAGLCLGQSPVSFDMDAAGRSALLGDIYDRIHESFTGSSAFTAEINSSGIVAIKGAQPAVMNFKIINEYAERNSFMGLSTSLQTSSYLGLVDLRGSAAVARKFHLRRNCINAFLFYKYTKGSHRLNLRSPYVQSLFVDDAAKQVHGTDVVVEVEYGTTISVGFHFEATASDDVSTLEASLTADVNSMVHTVNTDKTWEGESRRRLERTSFTAQVFGDSELGLNFVDSNITSIYSTLKKVPEMLNNSNGSPIRYKLYTADKFQSIIRGSTISQDSGVNQQAARGIQRIEEAVLSLYYEHEQNVDFYNEEITRLIRFSDILPEKYKREAQKRFLRYSSAFKRRHARFTNQVVAARRNYDSFQADKVRWMTEAFRFAKHGPKSFHMFLTNLSMIVTNKLSDFTLLSNGGFTYIPKNGTSSAVSLAHHGSSVFILFISHQFRTSKQELYSDCVASGLKVTGPKFVADCDILSLDDNCKTMNSSHLVQFRNGAKIPKNYCYERSSENRDIEDWATETLKEILLKLPHHRG